MIKLTDRLQKIADFVPRGARVADIGTDHGFIPLWLHLNGISDYIVAGDVNSGPLEKMKGNLDRIVGGCPESIVMRQGSGFEVFREGEVDTVVIAGMGGRLMMDIFEADRAKTASLKMMILQPRKEQAGLRKWLFDNGFDVYDGSLVRESRFVWEIMAVRKASSGTTIPKQYEVNEAILKRRDPLLRDFIENRIGVLNRIAEEAEKSASEVAADGKSRAESAIKMLRRLITDNDL